MLYKILIIGTGIRTGTNIMWKISFLALLLVAACIEARDGGNDSGEDSLKASVNGAAFIKNSGRGDEKGGLGLGHRQFGLGELAGLIPLFGAIGGHRDYRHGKESGNLDMGDILGRGKSGKDGNKGSEDDNKGYK